MIPPWVTDELRAHPYRMWCIHAIGLLAFTLILVSRMPAYGNTTYVYPTKPPRAESSTAVESKGIAVNKPDSVRPSRAPRGTVPDPLPGTSVPSVRPSPSGSEPSEPSPGPSVPNDPPSEPPVDHGPPSEPPTTPDSPTPNDPPPDKGGPSDTNEGKDKLPQRVADISTANEFGPRVLK
jgi:hypothetical protein